jgi:branched-chain amino acid transport system substrate-binding protein
MVSMSRALQSPSFVEAMSPSPEGLTIAAGWTPAYPYRSSLTGTTASGLAEDWSTRTDKQWTQPTAFTHALFEVAVDALKRADDPRNRETVAAAIGKTNVQTIVGRVDFTKGPAPHVAVTPMVGAQWRRSSPWPYELVIVHSMSQEIPEQGELRPLR